MASVDDALADISLSPVDVVVLLRRAHSLEEIETHLHDRLNALDEGVESILNANIEDFLSLSDDMRGIIKNLEHLNESAKSSKLLISSIGDELHNIVEKTSEKFLKSSTLSWEIDCTKRFLMNRSLLLNVEDTLNGDSLAAESGFSKAVILESVCKDIKAIQRNLDAIMSRASDLSKTNDNTQINNSSPDILSLTAPIFPKAQEIRQLAMNIIREDLKLALRQLKSVDLSCWAMSDEHPSNAPPTLISSIVHLIRSDIVLSEVQDGVNPRNCCVAEKSLSVIREVLLEDTLETSCKNALQFDISLEDLFQDITNKFLLQKDATFFQLALWIDPTIACIPLLAGRAMSSQEAISSPFESSKNNLQHQISFASSTYNDGDLSIHAANLFDLTTHMHGSHPRVSSTASSRLSSHIPSLRLVSDCLQPAVVEAIDKYLPERSAPAFIDKFQKDARGFFNFLLSLQMSKSDASPQTSTCMNPRVAAHLSKWRSSAQVLLNQKQRLAVKSLNAFASPNAELEFARIHRCTIKTSEDTQEKHFFVSIPTSVSLIEHLFSFWSVIPLTGFSSRSHEPFTPIVPRIKFLMQSMEFFESTLSDRMHDFQHVHIANSTTSATSDQLASTGNPLPTSAGVQPSLEKKSTSAHDVLVTRPRAAWAVNASPLLLQRMLLDIEAVRSIIQTPEEAANRGVQLARDALVRRAIAISSQSLEPEAPILNPAVRTLLEDVDTYLTPEEGQLSAGELCKRIMFAAVKYQETQSCLGLDPRGSSDLDDLEDPLLLNATELKSLGRADIVNLLGNFKETGQSFVLLSILLLLSNFTTRLDELARQVRQFTVAWVLDACKKHSKAAASIPHVLRVWKIRNPSAVSFSSGGPSKYISAILAVVDSLLDIWKSEEDSVEVCKNCMQPILVDLSKQLISMMEGVLIEVLKSYLRQVTTLVGSLGGASTEGSEVEHLKTQLRIDLTGLVEGLAQRGAHVEITHENRELLGYN